MSWANCISHFIQQHSYLFSGCSRLSLFFLESSFFISWNRRLNSYLQKNICELRSWSWSSWLWFWGNIKPGVTCFVPSLTRINSQHLSLPSSPVFQISQFLVQMVSQQDWQIMSPVVMLLMQMRMQMQMSICGYVLVRYLESSSISTFY